MVDNELPEDMYLGKEQSRWPIYVFESQAAALAWLVEKSEHPRRRVWLVNEINVTEMEAVVPEPRLQVKR